jgi:multidrug resistance efflux pump
MVALLSCLCLFMPKVWAIQPDMALPEHWGMPTVARKTTPSLETPQPPAVAGSPKLLLMPRGRLIVGVGTVNPADYLQQRGALASSYVLKAPKAGIVEWLSPLQHFFPAGFPLARLYDTAIIPDLAKAEAAARHYLDQPFTIVEPQRLPVDFPSPTTAVNPQLAQALPPPRPLSPTQPPPNPSGLQQQEPTSGLRMEPHRKSSRPAEQSTPAAKQPDNRDRFSEQLAKTRDQLTASRAQLAALEAQIAPLQAKVEQSLADLEAREGLYERGMIAANSLKTAQSDHRTLEAQLTSVTQECHDLTAAISSLQGQANELQTALDNSQAAAPIKPVASASARQPQIPDSRSVVSQPPRPEARRSSAQQSGAQPSFPSPTVTRVEPALNSRAEALGRSIQQLNSQEQQSTGRSRVALSPIPEALTRLADPRWDTLTAPTSGLVIERMIPDGEQVPVDHELVRVANTQWARMYADLSPEYLGRYRQGSPILITFDEYPDARFEGWINSLNPTEDGQALRAELYVLCTNGYWGADAHAMLRWLAGAAPVRQSTPLPSMKPLTEMLHETYGGNCSAYAMLPVIPDEYSPINTTNSREVPGRYVGYMQVAQLEATNTDSSASSQDAKQRLEKLAKWRQSFTEGMTTTIFPNQLVLTYPAEGEIRRAVEKMATGQVSNVNNRCARTMAEALGWGLGDAAQWASGLPRKGYKLRDDGLCRPGDILVWPFSYGVRGTQHVGIAVLQGGRMMMLSNLSGRLGTSDILPGYLAYHKPATTP